MAPEGGNDEQDDPAEARASFDFQRDDFFVHDGLGDPLDR
jgi:hypothetical protein